MQRIWQAHKLQPHRLRTFKRSTDPDFAAKLEDVVGLYVALPKHAIVPAAQAGQGWDHDPRLCPQWHHHVVRRPQYPRRHGDRPLHAAPPPPGFLRFLNAVERGVPAGKVIHAIVDNYRTHNHPKVKAWLGRHPRWTFHFTPKSGSWLNAVETFFSALIRRRMRRGSFHSVVDLQAAINRYIAEHNHDPKPFTWTQPADQIFNKLNRLNVSVH